MAEIDDKVNALRFKVESAVSPERAAQLVSDAAAIATASGEKVTLTQTSTGVLAGVVKNFVRVTHAVFTVKIVATTGDKVAVEFTIGDYMRSRDTLLYFIPVSPWTAPAYKTLKAFSEYLRGKL